MIKLFSKIAGGINNAKRAKTSAVILCAGSSTRFSSENESKQMALVHDKPVVLRTIFYKNYFS